MNCDSLNDLAFDFVYELLDEPEAKAVRTHAESCPACAARIEQARADQQKLGRAALAVVDVPEFTVPTDEPRAEPIVPAVAPAAAPVGRRGLRPITLMAWAASIACCVAVVGYFGLGHVDAVRHQDQRVADLVVRQNDLDTKLASLTTKVSLEQKQLPEKIGQSALQLHVAGPGKVSPGVSAGHQVALRDLNGQAKAGKIELEYVDAKDNVLAKKTLDVTAPSDVPPPIELAAANGPVRLKVRGSNAGVPVGEITETLTVAPPVYAGHLTVNKQLYKPGDAVLVRSLILDRATMKPAPDGRTVEVKLVADDGAAEALPPIQLTTVAGIGAGEIPLPAGLAEGSYTLHATGDRLVPVRRRIDVLPAVAPSAEVLTKNNRVKAGEAITLQLYNPDGTLAANAPVAGNYTLSEQKDTARNSPDPGNAPQAPANPNGAAQNFAQNQAGVEFKGRTDAQGRYQLKLPAAKVVSNGLQTLNVDVVYGDDKKAKAQLSQTIAVEPTQVAVDLYPEGGGIVAGIENKVYYRVRSTEGDVAADARIVVKSGDKTVYDSKTDRSVGWFALKPAVGETFRVQSPKSAGGPDAFASHPIQAEGIVLRGPAVQPADGDAPLKIAVDNRGPERLVQLVAVCRGTVVGHQRLSVKQSESIELPVTSDGIVRVTAFDVYDGHLTPLAERLFYRPPARRLDLSASVAGDGKSDAPLKIVGRDEHQQPVKFWGGACVVDDRFRGGVPEPSLAASFLVLGDLPEDADWSDVAVLGLADGNPQALELALGVHGWRRVVPEPAAANPTLLAKKREDAPLGAAKMETAKAGAALADRAKDLDGKAAGKPAAPKADLASAPSFGSDATFFYRVQPSLFELRRKLDDQWNLSQLALIDAAQKTQGELTHERNDVARQLSLARIELDELSRRPRERFFASLGVVALGLLAVGAMAMVFGLVRLVARKSATRPFVFACGSLVACFVLLAFRPEADITAPTALPGSAVVAEAKKRTEFAARPRESLNGEKAERLRQANEKVALERVQPDAAGRGVAPVIEAAARNRENENAAARRQGAPGLPGDQLTRLEPTRNRLLRDLKEAESKRVNVPETAEKGGRSVALETQQKAFAGFGGAGFGGGLGGVGAQPGSPPGAAFGPAGAMVPRPAADAKSDAVTVAPSAKTFPAQQKTAIATPKPPTDAPAPTVAPMAAPAIAPSEGRVGDARRDSNFDELVKKHAQAQGDGQQKTDLGALRRQFRNRGTADIGDSVTLFWSPALFVPESGIDITLPLPASPTRYRVLLVGHTADGRLGSYDGILNVK